MKVAVVQLPGSNCDQDALHSLREDVGVGAEYVWYEQDSLEGFDAVFLPGGVRLVRKLIRLPRNPFYDWTLLAFLWYQHAVVSGYGMIDDFKLGLKNLGQIFGKRTGGTHEYGEDEKNQFLDSLDSGLDAGF